jgi:HPt (histidine-containing phosphotransfer) domain-containing protein
VIDIPRPMLIQYLKNRSGELQEAEQSQSTKILREAAHKLRGNCTTFGFGDLYEMASFLEDEAAKGTDFGQLCDHLRALIAKLESYLTEVQKSDDTP